MTLKSPNYAPIRITIYTSRASTTISDSGLHTSTLPNEGVLLLAVVEIIRAVIFGTDSGIVAAISKPFDELSITLTLDSKAPK